MKIAIGNASLAIKSINTAYVKQNGYGMATDDRLQRTIDLVKTSMKLDTKITPSDVAVPVLSKN